MDEVDCIDDALLADVVAQGQAARKNIRGTYDNPEEAWLDGYVAGRFDGYFKASPITQEEVHEQSNQVLSER
jgi:hypothetical protein